MTLISIPSNRSALLIKTPSITAILCLLLWAASLMLAYNGYLADAVPAESASIASP